MIIKAVKHWDDIEEIILNLEEKEQKFIRDHYLCAILILEMMNPTNINKKIGGAVTRIIKNNKDMIQKFMNTK